jgi:hypothetical protein
MADTSSIVADLKEGIGIGNCFSAAGSSLTGENCWQSWPRGPQTTGVSRPAYTPSPCRRRRGIVRRRYPALQGGQERVDVHVRQFPRAVGGGRVRARVAV